MSVILDIIRPSDIVVMETEFGVRYEGHVEILRAKGIGRLEFSFRVGYKMLYSSVTVRDSEVVSVFRNGKRIWHRGHRIKWSS